MKPVLALLLAGALVVGACASGEPADDVSPSASTSPSPTATSSATPIAQPRLLTDDELRSLGVNELGRVFVSEWHEIQDTDATYKTSLATFRAQLQLLYDRGYRPISAEEFIDGTFPIPAGTSPVLLTFDDSYMEHLFFDDDGAPHPDSVVGILEAMEAEDPTWRARAVFAWYWPYPFRQTDPAKIRQAFEYLLDNGYEISNHSNEHDSLADMSSDEVEENLATAERRVAELLGRDRIEVATLTLPFGVWPQDRSSVISGEHDGWAYEHQLVFEVGWMPTRSPHHVDFDPHSILRVAAHEPWGEHTWEGWLEWMDEEPLRRFVSDGDPTTVTYPEGWEEFAGPVAGQTTRTYVP
ncbi:MAG: polysaccharide deacetylase family protein [Nitriliruptorales bacterium]|nr:polysaccharide deacetylase family protein [Nitriliruptorales bacterium]